MTGDEIITALEFLKILVCNTDTQRQVVISTIDFINSQNTKIEELESMYKQERADRLYLSQQNKSIIAGQKTLQRALSDEIAKNEELRAYTQGNGWGFVSFFLEFGKNQRAEAIKELLDKIEKQAIPNEDDVYWVELDDIYNIVKEMEGE